MSIGLLFSAFLSILITGVASSAEPADLVLKGGKIVTVDSAKPEAQALAAKGDTIVAIGGNDEIQPYIGPSTRVIDLKGKLAVPGFIDGHAHFTGLGRSKMILNLRDVNNWDEIVALVGDAAKKAAPGQWIVGRGWHQEKWDRLPMPNVHGYPTHQALSDVSPDNPVLLTHASGHMIFANAKAMELLGITRTTTNPPGGEILKDAGGNPIGVFRETAQSMVQKGRTKARGKRTPDRIRAESLREIELAMEECLSKGITSFQDAGSSFELIDFLKELALEGKLKVRLWVMIGESNEKLGKNLSRYKIINLGDKRLTVRAIKRFMDGALGAHGAWLLEPYTDLPTSTGLNTTPVGTIKNTALLAIENDFQLCVHAIGDRANRETLNIFEQVFKAYPGKRDLRWRIEHAQHLSAADIPRFGKLGVIASMQACHCTSDGPWVVDRLGRIRAEEGAYVWKHLMDTGALVSNGTDAPVEDVSPIACFYASVSRKLKDGSVFYPGQRMSREEALRSYTLNAAFAAFEEDIKGSLTPGKLADITVLSKDIMTIPEDEIPSTEVLYTIVGGKVMFENYY